MDTYLEDIILQSVENTADQQAREEIRQQADSINKIVHDFEHTYVKLENQDKCNYLALIFLTTTESCLARS